MKRAVVLSCLVVLIACVQRASADVIIVPHSATPTGNSGVYTDLVSGEWFKTATGTTSATTGRQDGDGFTGISSVSPYRFEGHTITAAGTSLKAYANFDEDIYFETPLGLNGYLEFDFRTQYLLDGRSNGGSAYLDLELWCGGTRILDQWRRDVGPGGRETFDGVITLSTRGAVGGNALLESGGYFPLTFVLIAGSNNGAADWHLQPNLQLINSRLAVLQAVRVFREIPGSTDFIQLQQGDYQLRSNNLDDIRPVPEPASLVLLGTGLAGFAGRAWRRRRG